MTARITIPLARTDTTTTTTTHRCRQGATEA